MSRDYETKLTITCDRCGVQATFILTEKQAREALEWKQLNTGLFCVALGLTSKIFDLCPECFRVFETDFIKSFPDAFRKAFDKG